MGRNMGKEHDIPSLKAIALATNAILKDERLVIDTVGLCCVICICLDKLDIEYDDAILSIEMRRLFLKWSKYSGNSGFPIPGGPTAYIEAVRNGELWSKSTKYGRLRWQLCRFMRKTARQLLKQYGEK